MASIYLIRHAQASFGSDDYDRLSPLGLRQAEALGRYLATCGIHFDALYSGDLRRQRDTARIAAAAQPGDVAQHVDARFNEVESDHQVERLLPLIDGREFDASALHDENGLSSRKYQKAIEATFSYWVDPDNEQRCAAAGLTTWRSFSNAAREAISDLTQAHGSGSTVGVVSSGGTIATIVSLVLGLPGSSAYRFFEPAINCAVTRLLYSGDRVSLAYFNDHSWLDLLGRQTGERLVTHR